MSWSKRIQKVYGVKEYVASDQDSMAIRYPVCPPFKAEAKPGPVEFEGRQFPTLAHTDQGTGTVNGYDSTSGRYQVQWMLSAWSIC